MPMAVFPRLGICRLCCRIACNLGCCSYPGTHWCRVLPIFQTLTLSGTSMFAMVFPFCFWWLKLTCAIAIGDLSPSTSPAELVLTHGSPVLPKLFRRSGSWELSARQINALAAPVLTLARWKLLGVVPKCPRGHRALSLSTWLQFSGIRAVACQACHLCASPRLDGLEEGIRRRAFVLSLDNTSTKVAPTKEVPRESPNRCTRVPMV
jgi:hypothetical protein